MGIDENLIKILKFFFSFFSGCQGCESSDFNLISDFFALHKTPFSDFQCIEKHIFSGISDYFELFLTDALTPLVCILSNIK